MSRRGASWLGFAAAFGGGELIETTKVRVVGDLCLVPRQVVDTFSRTEAARLRSGDETVRVAVAEQRGMAAAQLRIEIR